MSETPHIPPELCPQPHDVDYDLDRAISAVVNVRAHVPDNAFTASVLGTERAGHGVVVDASGLVVTIGYLITEANEVWLIDGRGRAVAGDVIGYDYETGFGLVQMLGRCELPPLDLGSTRTLARGTPVVFAGHGGRRNAIKAQVVARREFAGYWEYVLDEALYTTPPHPNWGGCAVIAPDGRLGAIGSLYLDQITAGGTQHEGNLSVPIDLLLPIMDELRTYGRTLKPARPWLGMFVSEVDDQLLVAGLYADAPAANAGLNAGDIVLAVGGQPAQGLAQLFRSVWAQGVAGCAINLTVEREGRTHDIVVHSVDRRSVWRTPAMH